MSIDAETINQFLAALTALVLIIIAWYNRQRTASAAVTAAATTQTAMTNQVMAAAPQMAPVPVAGIDSRIPGTTQHGSQFWMDADYTGPEPDEATKKEFSDAQAAYNIALKVWIEKTKKPFPTPK